MLKKVAPILALALILAFASKASAQEIDSFEVVDSICFAEEDTIIPVGVDGYGDYLWFADMNSYSGYRVDLSGAIISSAPLPPFGGHASAFYVDADHVYYGPIIDRFSLDPSWVVQSSGTSNALEDVHFIDYYTGWAVGTYGTILHTTDGGNTWAPQTSGTSSHFYGVYFIDANTGWAVGPPDTLFYTTNGGNMWNAQGIGVLTWFESVYFADANTGWAVGGNGAIVHTTDGGASWYSQTSGTTNTLYSVCFANADSGLAVGENGTILHTTDGGSSWNSQVSGTSDHLFGVSFPHSTRGWVVGDDGTILRTVDAGNNWFAQTSGTSDALLGVYFTLASRGWAVGDHGTILRTTDAGANWIPQSSGTSDALLSVFFIDHNHGWAVGDHGTILYASNGYHYAYGIIKYDWDWNILDTLEIPPVPYDPVYQGRSEDLGFDGTRWWIGGRDGDIYSWAPPEASLRYEFHHDVSDSGHHLDGLEAEGIWIYLSEMLTDTIYQYDMAGNLIRKYFYSGEGAGIFLEGMGFDPNGHFWFSSGWSTYCLYELAGIEVAENICEFFLTPKELNVSRKAQHTFMIHLHPCESLDVSKGDSAEVYVDVDGSCTFDGDEQYPAEVVSPSLVVKVYCSDLVDNDPKVAIYSVNGIPISDTLGNDILLSLDTFTPPSKSPKIAVSSNQFTLNQNYPNPFNPETQISFNLPKRTKVSLIIYNILGEKVKTLAWGDLEAGTHAIDWDGRDEAGNTVASGIYFYRLNTEMFDKTMKMVLMK